MSFSVSDTPEAFNSHTLLPVAVSTLCPTAGLSFDLYIQRAVLNKPGKLSSCEREHIQQHAEIGFTEFCFREDFTWPQLMMIYQHHEGLDGQGYPVRSVDEEIHAWAKICSIADVFDAITSHRPYRRAESIDSAIDYLRQQSGCRRVQKRCFEIEAHFVDGFHAERT